MEYDSDSGLYYFYQRWYDPVIGRFVSESPLGRMAEHLYGFCNNNPVSFLDPLGLECESESESYEVWGLGVSYKESLHR